MSEKRLRPSIKRDKIAAKDFLTYDLSFACEHCTHFKSSDKSCTMGYVTRPHLYENQVKSFLLSGSMAICRFQEID